MTVNSSRVWGVILAALTPVFVLGACLIILLVPDANASIALQGGGVAPQVQTLPFVARYGVVASATFLGIPLLLGIALLAATLAHARRDTLLRQKVMIVSAALLLLASVGLTPFAGPYFFPAAITAVAAVFMSRRTNSTARRHAPLAG